jgi:superfamily II DNA or RNA helicase
MMKLRPHQERIVESMTTNPKGQVIVPTGGGKTLCMIKDAQREFNSCSWDVFLKKPQRKTIVVVSPRILLAQQHCEEFDEFMGLNPMLQSQVLHVHSGDTHHYSTTSSSAIKQWEADNYRYNKLIFTTYHSLHRIQEAEINVDSIYFDEAHNSVQRHFFPAVEFYSSMDNVRCYFFTATPKYNKSVCTPSMDDEEIYGKEIERISARELIKSGYILPPLLVTKELQMTESGRTPVAKECEHLLATIDEYRGLDKILICARRTTQIVNLVEDTNFCNQLQMRGYNWMYITAKTGAFINGREVDRETFFNTLSTWGKEDNKRFIVLHHSILSEGINVPGLEAALFMRNMNTIAISQTIGRVIRTDNKDKKFGLVVVPIYDKVGISTAKNVTAVVDTILT